MDHRKTAESLSNSAELKLDGKEISSFFLMMTV